MPNLLMKRLLYYSLSALALLAAVPAQALQISIDNSYHRVANIALHYMTPENDWITEGWYVWQPYEHGVIEIDSNNSIFYIYVEFADGLINNTNEGAVAQWIEYRTFKLLNTEEPKHGKIVNFSMCRSDGKTAIVRLHP